MPEEKTPMYRQMLIIVTMLTASAAACADSIPIQPGLWEMTSTMAMPMLPQPQVNTMTECMNKDYLSLDEVGSGDMDPACRFETAQLDDSRVSWSFECPMEGGGKSRGTWEATSHGDRVEGHGNVTVDMQGQSMEMTMQWTGKRIGDCP